MKIGNFLKILDLEIENYNYDEILNIIKENISLRRHLSITYINAYIALTAQKNSFLKNDLNQFNFLYSDGVGIYWASKFLYSINGLKERISATDLNIRIFKFAQKNKFKIFLFGGGEKAVDATSKNLEKKNAKSSIVGIIERDLSFNEQILEKINQSNADIIFLGLGTPYQEKWIATLGKKCNIPIQIAVGSGIDFLSGTYQRAPKVMQNIGMEWLFRLFLEPKRLWKRYLLGIPHFLVLILKQKFIK